MHLPLFKTFYMLFRSSHLFHVLCKIQLEFFLLTEHMFYILRHFVYLDHHRYRTNDIPSEWYYQDELQYLLIILLGRVYELVNVMIVERSAT